MIHRRDNRKIRQREVALIATLALGAFLLLYAPSRTALTGVVYRTAPGIWDFGAWMSDAGKGVTTNFHLKRSLVHENEALKAELTRLQALVLDRNLLEEKVSKLEEALGRTVGDDRVVARVLAVPGWSPYDTLVLDVGSNNGVLVGDLVVYAGSGVVGEVIEVYAETAKAKLYSSPESERMVVVGPQAIPGKVHGRGLGNFEMIVPQGSAIAVGDEVRTPGGSLIVGIVGAIEETATHPTMRVFFRSPWNVTEMRSVEVLVHR